MPSVTLEVNRCVGGRQVMTTYTSSMNTGFVMVTHLTGRAIPGSRVTRYEPVPHTVFNSSTAIFGDRVSEDLTQIIEASHRAGDSYKVVVFASGEVHLSLNPVRVLRRRGSKEWTCSVYPPSASVDLHELLVDLGYTWEHADRISDVVNTLLAHCSV